MLDMDGGLSVSALIHRRGVEVRTLWSPVPPHQAHSFMSSWTLLCARLRSCLNRKGPSPNCSPNVGIMKLSKLSWYAEALSVPFTGTTGPNTTPAKQPYYIIPQPQNVTLGTVVRQVRSPGNLQTQTRPSDCQTEKRDSSLQRTHLHCSSILR